MVSGFAVLYPTYSATFFLDFVAKKIVVKKMETSHD